MTTLGDDKHAHTHKSDSKSEESKSTMSDWLGRLVHDHNVLLDLGSNSNLDREVENDPLIQIVYMIDLGG